MPGQIEEDLDECHDLIAEIEEHLSLHPLSSSSPLQRRYAHALEVRSEGAELLRVARTEGDMIVADRRVTRALAALEDVCDGLAALPDSDPSHSP